MEIRHFQWVHSGKHTKNYGRSTIFNGKTHCKLSFSIATLNFQRVVPLHDLHAEMSSFRVPSGPAVACRAVRQRQGHRDYFSWRIPMSHEKLSWLIGYEIGTYHLLT
jgi:hypothetical protein